MGKPEFTFRYKVRNWSEYNRALVRRGQLTLWFDESAVAAWQDMARSRGVCTENLIRIDEVTESPKVALDDRAAAFRPCDFGLATQVEESA
jgi:hypothetical protein